MTANNIHYNTSLPPVGDFYLWLKLVDGSVIKAKRTRHIINKTDAWPVVLDSGESVTVQVTGWAYP